MFAVLDVGSGVAQRGDVNFNLRPVAGCIRSKFIIGDAHFLPFRDNSFLKKHYVII